MVNDIINSNKEKTIRLGSENFKIINLTEPLRLDVEVFPGDPKPEKKSFCTFETAKCMYNTYLMGDHNFHPHGDAPNHQNPEYKSRGFEFWGLDFVFNKACLIDLSESIDACVIDKIKFLKKITEEHLLPHTREIEKNGAITIRTGYDVWIEANKKHIPGNIPHLDKSAADFLSKFKNLKVIGTDSLTIDEPGSNYAHRKFKDKLIVECLVNLHSIPQKYRNSFYLQTSPIAIAGATGGPFLAYAYISLAAD